MFMRPELPTRGRHGVRILGVIERQRADGQAIMIPEGEQQRSSSGLPEYSYFNVLWLSGLVPHALAAVVFFEQLSEVLILPASRFKIENLVFDANPQVVKRFL